MKKIIIFVFTLSVLMPMFVFASFTTSLRYGSKGSAVVDLQDFLTDQGLYSGKIDGRFGLIVRKAVIAFQKANGLTGDGYFGASSQAKANDILAAELQPSIQAEQSQTGTITPTNLPDGCTATSNFSIKTGKPCKTTTQPATPNLPDGCLSTSGFSITTGQACNGVAANVAQLTQTVQQQTQVIQQIQQNTAQIAQNVAPVVTPAPVVVPVPAPTQTPTSVTSPTPTPTVTMYTLSPSSSSATVPPTGQITEQQLRDFTASINPQLNWKVMSKNGDIKAVIKSLILNGFGISPDPLLYTISVSTNPNVPLKSGASQPPVGQITEQQLRDFTASLNAASVSYLQTLTIEGIFPILAANGYDANFVAN